MSTSTALDLGAEASAFLAELTGLLGPEETSKFVDALDRATTDVFPTSEPPHGEGDNTPAAGERPNP